MLTAVMTTCRGTHRQLSRSRINSLHCKKIVKFSSSATKSYRHCATIIYWSYFIVDLVLEVILSQKWSLLEVPINMPYFAFWPFHLLSISTVSNLPFMRGVYPLNPFRQCLNCSEICCKLTKFVGALWLGVLLNFTNCLQVLTSIKPYILCKINIKPFSACLQT